MCASLGEKNIFVGFRRTGAKVESESSKLLNVAQPSVSKGVSNLKPVNDADEVSTSKIAELNLPSEKGQAKVEQEQNDEDGDEPAVETAPDVYESSGSGGKSASRKASAKGDAENGGDSENSENVSASGRQSSTDAKAPRNDEVNSPEAPEVSDEAHDENPDLQNTSEKSGNNIAERPEATETDVSQAAASQAQSAFDAPNDARMTRIQSIVDKEGNNYVLSVMLRNDLFVFCFI